MNFLENAPLISGLAWTIAYIGLAYRGFKDKTPGMPLGALVLNFAWEVIFSLIYPPKSILALVVINTVWMILDVLIVITMLKYGPQVYQKGFGINRVIFYVMFFLGILASFGIMLLGAKYFIGLPQVAHNTFSVGKLIAIVQNMVMSILFLVQFYQRKNEGNPIKGQSFTIACAKWIGTPLTVGIVTVVSDPTGFMAIIYALTFICDTWYLVAIYRELQSKGLNPWKRL
ncbi:transmembrane-type terpene cyclase [Levilactobacillus acidifarinae]|uniref:transmembrane-type terpene cyclase n=1 Tax=Levilactobacillus acidifarinae TaxID=267364 RepID=UPI00070BC88D|nr:hypothetical protein [Levilactobacillus acidifarinae]GEO68192.1 hypothetical protein LAC03_01020 [Levilactobacillus acidifarinae]